MKRIVMGLLCMCLLVPNLASEAAAAGTPVDRAFLGQVAQGKVPGIAIGIGDARSKVLANWGEAPNQWRAPAEGALSPVGELGAPRMLPGEAMDVYESCMVKYDNAVKQVTALHACTISSNTKWSQLEDSLGEPDYEGYLSEDIVKMYQAGEYEVAFVREVGASADPGIASVHLTKSPKRSKDRIHVLYYDHEVAFDQPPVVLDGRTMVPMRALLEAFGYQVDWKEDTQTAEVAVRGPMQVDSDLTFTLNSRTITVNDYSMEAEVAPQLINGRILVPVRAIADALDLNARWDEYENAIYIEKHPSRLIGVPADLPVDAMGFESESPFRLLSAEEIGDVTYFKVSIRNDSEDETWQLSWPDTVFSTAGKLYYHSLDERDFLDDAWSKPIRPGETREGYVVMSPGVREWMNSVVVSVGLRTGEREVPVRYAEFNLSVQGGPLPEFDLDRYYQNSQQTSPSSQSSQGSLPSTDSVSYESPGNLPLTKTVGQVNVTVLNVENRDGQTFFQIHVENNRSETAYMLTGLSEMIVNGERYIHLGQNLDPNLQESIAPGESRDGYIAIPGNLNGARQIVLKTKMYGQYQPFQFVITP